MQESAARTLGPYRLVARIGAGGMGVVYRAVDDRLGREVAVKLLRVELAGDADRIARFEREARAAAALNHPHILAVFDVGMEDGAPYLVTELLEGETLAERVRRGRVTVSRSVDYGVQVARGLAAAHGKGIVHRDLKLGNLFLTTEGRIKILDFGLAKLTEVTAALDQDDADTLSDMTQPGEVMGTVGYMAPEQVRGLMADARSDLFSFGALLYELLSGRRPFKGSTPAETLAKILNEDPPALGPPIPIGLQRIVSRCLEKRPEDRFSSAHDVALALEAVAEKRLPETAAEVVAEEPRPYPGLSSFTEEDARVFFGREEEVEALWKRIGKAEMLALIGPSGCGKTSFVRAGVSASAPGGWRVVVCQPGDSPQKALARVMARELSGDADALERLLDFDDPDLAVEVMSDWCQKNGQALLVVDQFEELFTLSSVETQASFATLLGRLVSEAGIRVLLSMRDDFFYQCHPFPSLRSAFDHVIPLALPVGEDLERALLLPARSLGCSFEDDSLVEEMMNEAAQERGALPLLAFTVSRLWELRDKDRKLLTRDAYERIGGLAGALAQHAEATLGQIGRERQGIVRELFRNLVTAQGTRAARESVDLLSVFSGSQQESAREVLEDLIDARLLTAYEVEAEAGEEDGRSRRVELIHESLLSAWPRLVRWQTQDAEGALLRDQLRQAARTWDERERPRDLLWSGTAYREFAVWRERYPGGLTQLEEAFARAMRSHATRRRRRRRIATAAILVILISVLAVVGGFWRRSVNQTRRAEAANLLSLARLHVEDHPTAAIAHSLASLELADSTEVRRVVVEALWRGPTEFHLPTPSPYYDSLEFSADGRWLATADPNGGSASLWPIDGGPPIVLEDVDAAGMIRISPRGDLVAATCNKEKSEGLEEGQLKQELGLWSFPEGRFLRSLPTGPSRTTESYRFQFSPDGQQILTSSSVPTGRGYELVARSWPVSGGESVLVARLDVPPESGMGFFRMDPTWTRCAWTDGRYVRIARTEGQAVDYATVTQVEHDQSIAWYEFDGQGQHLVTIDMAGTHRVWSLGSDPPRLTHTLTGPEGWHATGRFNLPGTMLAAPGSLWDLSAPPDTEPLKLSELWAYSMAFSPDGRWLATGNFSAVKLWSLARTYPRVLTSPEGTVGSLAFTPDSQGLVSLSERSIRFWPVRPDSLERSRTLFRFQGSHHGAASIAVAPDRPLLAIGHRDCQITIIPLDGGPMREFGAAPDCYGGRRITVGPGAHYVATSGQESVRILNLESEEFRELDAGYDSPILGLTFTDDGALWVADKTTLRRWQLDGESPQVTDEIALSVPDGSRVFFDWLTADGRILLLGSVPLDRLWTQDLNTGETRELVAYSGRHLWTSLDPTGEIVLSYDRHRMLRVGPITGEEPHLLWGGVPLGPLAVSPDGKWIGSGGEDDTIRLWPTPDLSKPPLHTLPRDELIAKLESLTNLRVVRDPESSTGWKLTHVPFQGWKTVPTW